MRPWSPLLGFDVLGLFAFAASGALLAIERHFDVAGLGLFTVTGTLKALAFGLNVGSATALGVLSAVGGGLIRDVIARETPALVRSDSVLYAVPAFFGALALAAAVELGAPEAMSGAVAATGIFTLRVLALRRRWRAPIAWRAHRDESDL
jgi:uncharacterized membrane protein YeiH